MDKNVYAIFDKQIGRYMNPLVFINDGEAIRWFTTCVNPPHGEQSNVSLYPEHFVLYRLGTYSDVSGNFDSVVREIIVGNAVLDTSEPRFTVEELLDMMRSGNRKE